MLYNTDGGKLKTLTEYIPLLRSTCEQFSISRLGKAGKYKEKEKYEQKKYQESLGCHVDSCFVPGGNHAREVLPPLDRT